MKKILFSIVFLGFASMGCIAQVLHGRVVSAADQRALPGASVTVRNSTAGVSADSAGRFSIRLPAAGSMLTVSSVGYLSRDIEVPRDFASELLVALEPAANTLSEVLVSTGFQEMRAERATGSYVKVGSELLNRRVSTDILSRLEHVVPGLVFNQGRGAAAGIRIRGQSTIFAEASPLIVLDNFPFEGDINTINPNDVESITVLKDAAAASIWGARSGNGVIVITTRKGKFNRPAQLSVNSNITSGAKPDVFYTPAMSSADYIENEKRLFNSGFYRSREMSPYSLSLTPVVELLIAKRDGVLPAAEADRQIEQLKLFDVRKDFDRYLYRRSLAQQYNISLNGGSARHDYTLSAGVDRNLLSLARNDYSRITGDFQNSFSLLKERIRFSAGINYSTSLNKLNNAGPGSISMTPATGLYPYARLADDEGKALTLVKDYRESFLTLAQSRGLLNWQYKPLDELYNADNRSRNVSYRLNSALTAKLLPGLDAELRYQYFGSNSQAQNQMNQESFYTRDLINQLSQVSTDGGITRPIPLGGILDLDHEALVSQNFRAQLNYRKSWANVHDLNIMTGSEVQERIVNAYDSRVYGYDDEHVISRPVDYISAFKYYYNPALTRTIEARNERQELTDRFLAYYANTGYTFKDRYTLSLSGRLDKSNLFGVNTNQKGVGLWSAGLAWTASNEPFYKAGWLPFLKMRLSYGYNGNVDKRTSAYTTATYNAGNTTPTRLPYATISNPPNPELRWERVKIMNGGLDFESRKGIISGSVDLYVKTGIDLIGSTPFPASTGILNFRGNTANTRGQGLDIMINTLNFDKRFKWNSNFIFSYAADKVTDYAVKATGGSYVQFADGTGTYPFVGKPVYGLYSYAWGGLDPQTGEQLGLIDGAASKDYAKIIASVNPENIIYHGPARPVYFGALRNSFAIANFSLSATIGFKAGYFFRRPSVSYTSVLNGRQSHGDYALRWQKPGDEKRTIVPAYPTTVNGNRESLYTFSEVLVEKADHIRLQDVNLSYDISRTLNKLNIKGGQLFLYANNLGILWKATGSDIDPDYLIIPPARTIAAGFRANF